jgi:ubiquinone/menaquinone biosynthesis C-methylase UbiE
VDEDDFAKALLSHERREWQNPDKIVLQIGVRRGMTVADLACGPGFFVTPLAKTVGKEGIVYAVDHSPKMIAYLNSTLERSGIEKGVVQILESDVTNTKVPSASCDIVLFANVLHDIKAPMKFLNEVKRMSKVNGIVVDIDWKDVDNGFGPPPEIRLSESKSKEILEGSGLCFIKEIDAGRYHYGLVLTKK